MAPLTAPSRRVQEPGSRVPLVQRPRIRCCPSRNTRAANDVAGHPHHEDVTDADIEEDLRRYAGIGTTDDYGFGELPVREGLKFLRAAAGIERFSSHKAVVADEQLTQRFVCVHRARG